MDLVRKRILTPLSVIIAVATGAFAIGAPVASAAGSWGGNNPAYTWTTGNGSNYYYSWELAEVSSGPANICVGPVQWNGSTWVFPYGWHCKNTQSFFSHPAIVAAHGVYNPNGSRQYFGALFE